MINYQNEHHDGDGETRITASFSQNLMRKIISFMHLSLGGFVAGPNGEMNWIKANEEIFDHVSKRISLAS